MQVRCRLELNFCVCRAIQGKGQIHDIGIDNQNIHVQLDSIFASYQKRDFPILGLSFIVSNMREMKSITFSLALMFVAWNSPSSSFSPSHASNRVRASTEFSVLYSDLFKDMAVTVRAGDFHDQSGYAVVDPNGRAFAVGAVVRVCIEDMRAYQVNPKFHGSFDKDKKFVSQASKTASSGRTYLAVPIGMRGTVTKVYDENVISANLPIQVKFEPGKNIDEGFDPPCAFLMHFTSSEIEVV